MIRKQFEYTFILKYNTTSDEEWEEDMDDLGKEGWELVTITPETERYLPTAYFKREYDGY